MNANNDNYDENGLPIGNKPNYVVVPIEIWEAENLSWSERVLLVEIDRHTRHGRDCFISNAHIAHFLNTSEKNASKLLNSLIKKGYVVMTRFDGRKRFISSTLETVVGSIPQSDGVSIHQKVESDPTKKATILVNEYNSNEFNSIEKENKKNAQARAREAIIADIKTENQLWIDNMMMHHKVESENEILELAAWGYDQVALKGNEPTRGDIMKYCNAHVSDWREYKRREAIKAIPINDRRMALWDEVCKYREEYSYTIRFNWTERMVKPSKSDPDIMIFEEEPGINVPVELNKYKLRYEQRNQYTAL